MKTNLKMLLLAGALLFPAAAFAQQYSNNWYKVSGGGGTSTNGNYTISGTIGQQDASGPMTTANGYTITGGFWAIYAVQTTGRPILNIRFAAPDSAIVFWLANGSYNLQTNGNLAATNWVDYGGTITTSNGTNSVTFTPPKGNLYFRLSSGP
jgi:hypothetical protein